jgi:hypothetical protein
VRKEQKKRKSSTKSNRQWENITEAPSKSHEIDCFLEEIEV